MGLINTNTQRSHVIWQFQSQFQSQFYQHIHSYVKRITISIFELQNTPSLSDWEHLLTSVFFMCDQIACLPWPASEDMLHAALELQSTTQSTFEWVDFVFIFQYFQNNASGSTVLLPYHLHPHYHSNILLGVEFLYRVCIIKLFASLLWGLPQTHPLTKQIHSAEITVCVCASRFHLRGFERWERVSSQHPLAGEQWDEAHPPPQASSKPRNCLLSCFGANKTITCSLRMWAGKK